VTRVGSGTCLEGRRRRDPSFPLYRFVLLVALGIDLPHLLMPGREEGRSTAPAGDDLTGSAPPRPGFTSGASVMAARSRRSGSLPLLAFAEIGFAVAFRRTAGHGIVRSVR